MRGERSRQKNALFVISLWWMPLPHPVKRGFFLPTLTSVSWPILEDLDTADDLHLMAIWVPEGLTPWPSKWQTNPHVSRHYHLTANPGLDGSISRNLTCPQSAPGARVNRYNPRIIVWKEIWYEPCWIEGLILPCLCVGPRSNGMKNRGSKERYWISSVLNFKVKVLCWTFCLVTAGRNSTATQEGLQVNSSFYDHIYRSAVKQQTFSLMDS